VYHEIELARFTPELVYVDGTNHIVEMRRAIPVQAA